MRGSGWFLGCSLVWAMSACGGGSTVAAGGSGTTTDTQHSDSPAADTGAVDCPTDITTCGDRICKGAETAQCCPFDCEATAAGAAGCINSSCHTEMLGCRSDAVCMASVNCALACKMDATCRAGCAKQAGSYPAQALFKCLATVPQCWTM